MGFLDNINRNCSSGATVDVDINGGGSGGGGDVSWGDVKNKPLQFPPTAHTHPISEVIGLDTTLLSINNELASKVDADYVNSAIASKADISFVEDELASKSNVGHTHTISEVSGLQNVLNSKLDKSEKGSNNGLAELDENGKVPSSQLPSYVDDVEEYDTDEDFPIIGESGKIYITRDTNLAYRWSGTNYAEISPSLALGETIATAYRGDRGKIAYDHSQVLGNPHNTAIEDIDGLRDELDGKQPALQSTINIKSINGQSILGSGNMQISSSPISLVSSGLSDNRTTGSGNQSVFFGTGSGQNTTNSDYSNFFGQGAGSGTTNANSSNFFGYRAGGNNIYVSNSNFFGDDAGYNAKEASQSNFFGALCGNGASNASYSNFFGYRVGSTFSGNNLGSNNIIIGTNISLPNATSDSINLGGVLFGTGTHNSTANSPSIVPTANGRIGIGVVNPSTTLEVNGVITASGGNSDDWNNKVDAEAGKGLSTNDYSNSDKDKLDSIGLEWFGTRAQYDALGTYNPTTKYFIEKEA